ncbi:S8 family peptidase [Plantactinospora endophytica]|uniref:Peptidase S8/S53 domain-containing protein n=1 Tax=Plantactinospora endophytica TaxID=673535 RepID=A0ABQ4E0B3_9ACTN|nr:S8/S53 family peptidase [Plantactinospora endophytica]GIG88110.1 hypothetical protein Pen02_30460 [Plantactinospora endophytica]
MPPSEHRVASYHDRRQRRLGGLAQLRSVPAADRSRVWYVNDELLVVDDERRHVERYLTEHRAEVTALGDEEVVPGLRRYRTRGLDVPGSVRQVRGGLPSGAAVVAPNHVFLSTPFNHGGPFGPPVPVASAPIETRRIRDAAVPMAIVDTGLWTDTVLPDAYYRGRTVDVETETDVDNDGLLDGDVGHANFIAGVVVRQTRAVRLDVLKVLDTFGICTEADLVQALGRLDPDIRVVNLSLGGFTEQDLPPVGLGGALETALAVPDRVVVAAAGNDGNRVNRFWPAAFAGAELPWSNRIAAVAAHDGERLCTWSNAGPWVSVAARGQDVASTFINHPEFFPTGWAQWSGTSFATPRVAAEVVRQIAAGMSAPAALRHVVESAAGTFDGYRGLR